MGRPRARHDAQQLTGSCRHLTPVLSAEVSEVRSVKVYDFIVTMWIMLGFYIGTCVGRWVFKRLHQDCERLGLSR